MEMGLAEAVESGEVLAGARVEHRRPGAYTRPLSSST